MLINPTIDKIHALKLFGMAKALESQQNLKDLRELSFEERLAILIDAECLDRENKRTALRLRAAKLRISACMEDLKVRPGRGLDRSVIASLATCDWVRDKFNIAITGPTGAGKTYLACALAHTACRLGLSTAYYRATTLFDDLAIAKGDGRYKRMLASIQTKKLIIIDDFGLEALSPEARRDLLEILEARYNASSTIITSQFDVAHWHELIGDPTLADAILDRFVHNSQELKLKGKSMRDPKNHEQIG